MEQDKAQAPEPDGPPKNDLESIVPRKRSRNTRYAQMDRHRGWLVATLEHCRLVTAQAVIRYSRISSWGLS